MGASQRETSPKRSTGPGSGRAKTWKLIMLLMLASMHMIIILSVLSQYYRAGGQIWWRGGSRQRYKGSNASMALKDVIAEIKMSGQYEEFSRMSDNEIMAKLDKAMKTTNTKKTGDMSLDRATFCKLAALKSSVGNNTSGQIILEEPRKRVTATGVIVTTYFTSRVDPLRCYKHEGGRMESDAFSYIEHWYVSVRHQQLPAVIFHESLSDAFTDQVATEKIQFQKVQLARYEWSLCDERWAVYYAWLQGEGVNVKYVLQMDVSDAVLAKNPFQLMERRAAEYDLWVNSQKFTPWVTSNYVECYGKTHDAILPDEQVFNAGVVGGRRDAFVALAKAMVDEFTPMYGNTERRIYNCDMSALHHLLTSSKFPYRSTTSSRRSPFCAGGIKCWKRGECDYYIYHK